MKNVLFHLPLAMLRHCFDNRDIRRLETSYQCHFPKGNDPAVLLRSWDEHAPSASVVVTGWDSPAITDSMLAVAPNIKAIIHAAGSIRPFIPESVWDSGIRIATANDALGKGVAETTMGLILAGLKGFFPCAELTRTGNWQASIPSRGYGRVREMYQVKIGIIGASKTGRHVLRLLSAYETEVLLYDPTLDASEAASLNSRLVSLEELMRQSDVVSLHAPALPQLRHMVGAREIALMKNDAIFINTARGMLVDENALGDMLKTGRISAILDVTYPEPPASDHCFRSLPNVTLLPHIAGALSTGCLRQGRSAVDQLLELHAGHMMHGELSRERFEVMA